MPVHKTKLLVISNGHGEDSIGAALVKHLPQSFAVSAYPTLGGGRAYAGVCEIVGPRAELPSEGWRNVKNSVAKDIAGGGISTIWPGLAFIRRARGQYDRVVVVGDMIGVYGCWITGHRDLVYLDVYKTGFGSPYLSIDKWILRRTTRTMFSRSPALAATLKAAGIDARHVGNIMMDTIPRSGSPVERRRSLGLTILPGSRAHALQNFALQAAALSQLSPELMPDLFLAVAPSLDIAALAAAADLTHQRGVGAGRLTSDTLDITLLPGAAMGDALDASDLVLSQAGTATVQAIGLGRPSITFQTADDRPSRFRQEGRLFGEARQVVTADPEAIAQKLQELLSDTPLRERLASVGRERIGPPGAMDAIIADLLR